MRKLSIKSLTACPDSQRRKRQSQDVNPGKMTPERARVHPVLSFFLIFRSMQKEGGEGLTASGARFTMSAVIVLFGAPTNKSIFKRWSANI